MSRGRYIVLEGPEGVGKTTQIEELAHRLRVAGLPVRTLREPDSQSDLTARALRQLTQDPRYPMNTNTEVLLYNAARSQSLQVIKNSVEQGVICIVDRNYLTTLAIQYYGRGDVPDYETINRIIGFAVNGVEPDLCIVMDAPVQLLKERAKFRGQGERFDNLDEAFLERVRAGYLWEAKQRNLPVVFATDTPEQIANTIWKLVTDSLGTRQPSNALSVTAPQSIKQIIAEKRPIPHEPPVDPTTISSEPATDTETADAPWTQKNDNGSTNVTEAGKAQLRKYTTNSEGSVYGFTDQMSPVTVAAAMARLSRRGDDMRVTLLDEFIGKVDKDAQLLHRVITAYGDDSVQQLVGQHFVVEGASVLLTKKLERGRLAAYLEQSTRYIYFDQKDSEGHYRYFIPTELKGKARSQYIKSMNQIFDLYSEMVNKLTTYIRNTSSVPKAEQDAAWRSATKAQACDAVRDVLPLATKTTVGIFASGQSLEGLIMRLLGDDLAEARATGQSLLEEGRKTVPVFLERADKPDRGGAAIAYRAQTRAAVQKLADELLPQTHTAPSEPVKLTSYTPHNELDIVADMLYEFSDLPLEEIQKLVAGWSYDQKVSALQAYVGERLNRRHRPGRALEKIHYSFDLTAKYGSFKDMQRHRMVDDLQWQLFTPRLGYDVPKLVDEGGLTEQFERCFELSLELFSSLQASHGPVIAQYTVLHGHNIRWKVTINAREAFQMLELRSSPQGHPAYRKLAQQMHDKIAEIHPLLAEAMTFMNKGEDEELTRLAAERYTQFKLEQLDSK